MPRTRRTQAQLYPKFLTFSAALAYYESIPPVRGHRDNPARPLAKGRRTAYTWRITPTTEGIACMNGAHAVITYYKSGFVRLSPSASSAQEVAIIRAIAPVDMVKWDYYNNCLVVRVGDTRYTCKVGESILLPPVETSAPERPA